MARHAISAGSLLTSFFLLLKTNTNVRTLRMKSKTIRCENAHSNCDVVLIPSDDVSDISIHER
jgi:hypothetical protein